MTNTRSEDVQSAQFQHYDNGALELLIEHGLLNIIRADANLNIISQQGTTHPAVPIGSPLCENIEALHGCDEELHGLKSNNAERFELTNVTNRVEANKPVRHDYVVLFDAKSETFLLSITPTLAFTDLSVEREQSLRNNFLLQRKIATQAEAIQFANEALRRTNADLSNFTRIISHDLKAPMRAIRYTADDIEETLIGTEIPEQLDALAELRQHSERLSHMVSDLLTYSALDDKAQTVTEVDTHALVKEIVATMPKKPGLDIQISGNWPTLNTCRTLLDIVLRNVIDNSIKYHNKETGLTTIKATPLDLYLSITVTDDGPGIPEKYRTAVLKPFVKIDPDSSTSSGLGLSLVAKILAQVGGHISIHARADLNFGTSVNIAWPLTIRTT